MTLPLTPKAARRGLMILASFWAFAALLAARGDTQTFKLDAGWNLISFQVVPTNPAPAAVFGALGTAFERAFAFNGAASSWSTFGRAPGAGETALLPPLPPVAPGQAYWIYMNQAVPSWSVQGGQPATNPAVNLAVGWNMIGIPAGTSTLPEPVNMLSVLAASGLSYDSVLRWEQSLYTKFSPADGAVDDFTAYDPNRGYWVHVKGSAFSLQPKLLASVRPDQDVPPTGNYPSYEDLVISGAPSPLGASDQTTIRFFPGEETQTLALANTGGGIMLWQLSNSAPWLQLSAVRGVTTIENDVITLSLDRSMMTKGHYETTLALATSAGSRSWRVVADVGGLAGDWHGSAVITTVNGKKNPVPDIDLHIAFFEDSVTPGLIRGVIDSQNALLWPVDVPLIGHSDSDNNIALGGGFVLPPGDVNRAPLSEFNPSMEDIDWNCNGKFDAVNPFPFPIYRSVSLQGQLTAGSPANGYVIEGDYVETVYGMLRQPIQVNGRFKLIRENPVPFSARRPVANQESPLGNQPVVLKRLTSTQGVPVGASSASLTVGTDMQLASLGVELDISGVAPGAITATLITPSGASLILHDKAGFASLSGVVYPDNRKPESDFGAYLATGPTTRGVWKLSIQNQGPTTGRLDGFGLRLEGQPVFDVTGTVQGISDRTTNVLSLPASVFLDGLPYNAVTMADTNGNFRFARQPGIPFNLSASLPGWKPINPSVPGLGSMFTVPQYNTNCLSPDALALASRFRPLPVTPLPAGAVDGFGGGGATNGNSYGIQLDFDPSFFVSRLSGFIGFPFTGPAPLPVDFVVLDPNPYDGTPLVTWNYGDGSPSETVGSIYRSHTYATPNPTGYVASISANQGTGQSSSFTVYPMPSPGNSPYALNFFSVNFTSGGSLPVSEASFIVGTNDVTRPAALATLLQVQQTYAASFDIDLAPSGPVGSRFDSDGFDPLNTVSNPANRDGNFRDEDYTYSVVQGTDPGDWSLAAACGDVLPSDTFRGYPQVGQTGDCAGPRFEALCNIGPMIVPPTIAEVYPVTPGAPPIFPSNPDPLDAGFATGIGSGGDLRLITGPLASYWNDGGAR